MKNTEIQPQPTATAMMRITHIKFDHVVPAHILAGINEGYDKELSTCPVISMKVLFHQSGEPYGVRIRMNGYTLGSYGGDFTAGIFMKFSPEVVAYLSHAADQALAIVQPLATSH